MCGILGIMGNGDIAQEIYDGLTTLQHRGQDSAGIMTFDGHFNLKKGNGLVRDVFHTKNMLRLKGPMGIGHVRYPTAGSFDAAEAQPFFVNSPFGIALIHNGNLTNYEQLKEEIVRDNIRYLNTSSDSEVLLNVVANEILKINKLKLDPEDIFNAMKIVFKRLKGSYSCIMMIADHGMIAFRDPNGLRPLVIGERKNDSLRSEYVFASESVALAGLGFDIIADVQPGEVVYVDMNRDLHRKQCVEKDWAPCIFEFVYLARPDSVIDKISVYKTRLRMGTALAKQIREAIDRDKLEIDVVMPVPDTARSSALAVAEELGLKYREGLIKNRYIGRTFIMPGQAIRKKSIKYKLMPIELEIRGKNILLVDDSIVRGNTCKKIIQIVREAGAKSVYFASSAPPLRSPCVYGVDMPSKKDFIANKLSIDEICKTIGADGLFYQKLEDLIWSAHEGNKNITKFCAACMDGKYPTKDITEQRIEEMDIARSTADRSDNGEFDKSSDDQLTLI
ncbi:MAG: amidophosphoribosyltransferase [Candidatus Peregrinibacteria bacterium]|nr:amidophosphoribosyltransferase [Candidatus Peregrinibacteria bacterium]